MKKVSETLNGLCKVRFDVRLWVRTNRLAFYNLYNLYLLQSLYKSWKKSELVLLV